MHRAEAARYVKKLVMKRCTENDTEVIRSALISLKLPIKRTVIKIPAKISGAWKNWIFPCALKGAWLKQTGQKWEGPTDLYKPAKHVLGITCSFAYAEPTSIRIRWQLHKKR